MYPRGYLLDVNHVGAFIREEPGLMAKANLNPPECMVWICSITLGEIEASHRGMTVTTNQQAREEYIQLVHEKLDSFRVDVSEFTPEYYGEIMGRMWQNDPPKREVETERRLLELGVDVNDVWTVAVAWEHGLTLLTQDKMEYIKKALKEEIENREVGFDCWI